MSFINSGITLMILVAVYQSVLSAIAKDIAPSISTGTEVLAYYSIPLIYIIPAMLCNMSHFKTNRLGFYFLRGMFASGSVFCFFYASKTIPLSTAALLFNLTPIFIPIFSRLFLGEVTSKQVACGILISLAGVVVVMHPSYSGLVSCGSLIGLASGVLMALAQVMLRYLSRIKEPVEKIVFYVYLTSTIFSLFVIVFESLIMGENKLVSHTQGSALHAITMLSILGVIGLIAQRTLTKAFQYMPAAKLAPFLYISIPVSSLLGRVIWKQPITADLYIGALLILSGVLFITFEKNRELKCVAQQS